MSEEETIKEWSNLVHFVGNNIHSKLPKGTVHYDEIYSAGLLGLLLAVREEDKSKGVKFKTWAQNKITYAIQDYLRELDPFTRRTREHIKNGVLELDLTSLNEESEDWHQTDEHTNEYCDLEEMMLECLDELVSNEQYVIRESYFKGRIYKDIGLDINKSDQMVGHLVRKTLFKLSMMLSIKLYPPLPKEHDKHADLL